MTTSYDTRQRNPFVQKLTSGGMAGVIARTFVAPVDRVKILLQTGRITGTDFSGFREVVQHIQREGSVQSFWKGNGTNCIRVFPHVATQFAVFSSLKEQNHISNPLLNRLVSGSASGAAAATVTQPLDVIRIRIQTDPECSNFRTASRQIWQEQGVRGLYRGYTPTLFSLCPFIALNFTLFDYLSSTYNPDRGSLENVGLGAIAGAIAQTVCFPLDTVRRNLQVKGSVDRSAIDVVKYITSSCGIQGLYRGILPNLLKVVPNNAIRFGVFTYFVNQRDLKG